MGIRDIFSRSRSKSRGRNAAPAETEEAPPVPAPPPPEQTTEQQQPPAEESLPPLALMRPDSGLVKEPPKPEIEGTPYTYDGDDSKRGASFSYDRFKPGELPTRGTLPLHGNAPTRIPSEAGARKSKSLNRNGSVASSQRRPLSEARAPSINRRSIPPGTAVSTDRPVTQIFDFPGAPSSNSTEAKSAPPAASQPTVYTDTSSKGATSGATTAVAATTAGAAAATAAAVVPVAISSRQPVQTNVQQWQKDKGPTQLDNRPAVPVVPGQFQPNGPINAATPPQNRHDRVTSVSSRASTSSRTPIADEFASSSWYGRPGTPKAPSWSDVHGGTASPSPPPPLPPALPREPSPPLPRQPEIDDNSRRSHKSIPSSSSVATDDTGAPPSRGRLPRRSYDRPLPIPKELRNAPWNRPENAHILASGEQTSNDIDTFGEKSAAPNSTIIPSSSRSPTTSFMTDQTKPDVRPGQQTVYSSRPTAQGASEPPSLDGVVNLQNTTDTTVHTRQAPAVVHEMVKPTVTHVTEEQITREIHTHDVHHRVLPIHDVQVLPAKHFVPASDGSGFVEVPAESLPGRAHDKNTPKHWVIAETVSKSTPTKNTSVPSQPVQKARGFTARTFGSDEGNYEEWIGEDGVKRTRQTWIHPPTVPKAPVDKGITVPIQVDSNKVTSLPEKQPRTISGSYPIREPQVPVRNSSKRVSHMRSQSLPQSKASDVLSSSTTDAAPESVPRPTTQPVPAEDDNAAVAANAAMEEPRVRDFAEFSPSSEASARIAAKRAVAVNNNNPSWPFSR